MIITKGHFADLFPNTYRSLQKYIKAKYSYIPTDLPPLPVKIAYRPRQIYFYNKRKSEHRIVQFFALFANMFFVMHPEAKGVYLMRYRRITVLVDAFLIEQIDETDKERLREALKGTRQQMKISVPKVIDTSIDMQSTIIHEYQHYLQHYFASFRKRELANHLPNSFPTLSSSLDLEVYTVAAHEIEAEITVLVHRLESGEDPNKVFEDLLESQEKIEETLPKIKSKLIELQSNEMDENSLAHILKLKKLIANMTQKYEISKNMILEAQRLRSKVRKIQ